MNCQQCTGFHHLLEDSGWRPSGSLDLVILSLCSFLLIVSLLTSGGPSYLASSEGWSTRIFSCVDTGSICLTTRFCPYHPSLDFRWHLPGPRVWVCSLTYNCRSVKRPLCWLLCFEIKSFSKSLRNCCVILDSSFLRLVARHVVRV